MNKKGDGIEGKVDFSLEPYLHVGLLIDVEQNHHR